MHEKHNFLYLYNDICIVEPFIGGKKNNSCVKVQTIILDTLIHLFKLIVLVKL